MKRRRWRTGQGLQGMCSFNHLGAVRVGGGGGGVFTGTVEPKQPLSLLTTVLCCCVTLSLWLNSECSAC